MSAFGCGVEGIDADGSPIGDEPVLKFLSRLFKPAAPEIDLSLWPYPLGPGDERLLLWHAVRVAGVTLQEKDGDMVDLLAEAQIMQLGGRPSEIGPFMTPDDLSSFDLDRRLKISADFFVCLDRTARKNPGQAEQRLIRVAVKAIGNRSSLNQMVQCFSPKQIVELETDEAPCPQSFAFRGQTWASVAPDLPLPGCSSKHCLCVHKALIEF